jgi:hypothetical protein
MLKGLECKIIAIELVQDRVEKYKKTYNSLSESFHHGERFLMVSNSASAIF